MTQLVTASRRAAAIDVLRRRGDPLQDAPPITDRLHADFCARLWESADGVQREELRRASWFVMPKEWRDG